MSVEPRNDGGIGKARAALIDWLANQFGSEAADDRADCIMRGREDDDAFIHGYLAALAQPVEAGEDGLREALSDSQSTLSAIKAECIARTEQEEDQMASHIAEICQTTMLTNAAALGTRP